MFFFVVIKNKFYLKSHLELKGEPTRNGQLCNIDDNSNNFCIADKSNPENYLCETKNGLSDCSLGKKNDKIIFRHFKLKKKYFKEVFYCLNMIINRKESNPN